MLPFFARGIFLLVRWTQFFFPYGVTQTFFIPAESKSWEPVCVSFPLTRTFAKVNMRDSHGNYDISHPPSLTTFLLKLLFHRHSESKLIKEQIHLPIR